MLKPNILYVMVDCLRADVCYGVRGSAKKPAIDALRRKGTSFTSMISVTSTTTPNVSTLFTGVYPYRHGIRSLKGYKLSKEVKTLAEVLSENGYNTYGIVSGPVRRTEMDLDRGFGFYETYRNEKGESLFGDWFNKLKDTVTGFKAPWFAYLHLWELHTPRRVLKEFDNGKSGDSLYERSLSSIDSRLGELFSTLPENTVIIVSGDHGENYQVPLECLIRNKLSKVPYLGIRPSRRHPKYDHGYGLYDFLIRIPFIMSGPGIPEGMSLDLLASQVDMMPTLLEIAGVKDLPGGMHGRSLVPAMSGERLEPRPVFLDATARNIPAEKDWLKGVRTDEWKLVFAPRNDAIEPLLYNLREDPDERENLYFKLPDVAERLKRLILDHEAGILEKGMTLSGGEMTEEENEKLGEFLRSLGYVD